MKKLTPKSLLAIVFIAVASTLLGSCKRDKLSKEPDGPPCQIKKIIVGHPDPLVAQRSGEFTYNAAGDPITYTPQGYTTGSCKYEFRYDNKGRLTEYIGYYPSGSFEFWARFTYNDKNKIIRDTSYHYGPYGPVLTTYYNVKRVTEYEYDQEGRVSRRVWKNLLNDVPMVGAMGDYKYTYNDQGNLVVAGAVYDDKVSIYRLHKVWMFLSCNYSKNNILQATGYNDNGLPTGFPAATQQSPYLGMLYFIGLNGAKVEYDCK